MDNLGENFNFGSWFSQAFTCSNPSVVESSVNAPRAAPYFYESPQPFGCQYGTDCSANSGEGVESVKKSTMNSATSSSVNTSHAESLRLDDHQPFTGFDSDGGYEVADEFADSLKPASSTKDCSRAVTEERDEVEGSRNVELLKMIADNAHQRAFVAEQRKREIEHRCASLEDACAKKVLEAEQRAVVAEEARRAMQKKYSALVEADRRAASLEDCCSKLASELKEALGEADRRANEVENDFKNISMKLKDAAAQKQVDEERIANAEIKLTESEALRKISEARAVEAEQRLVSVKKSRTMLEDELLPWLSFVQDAASHAAEDDSLDAEWLASEVPRLAVENATNSVKNVEDAVPKVGGRAVPAEESALEIREDCKHKFEDARQRLAAAEETESRLTKELEDYKQKLNDAKLRAIAAEEARAVEGAASIMLTNKLNEVTRRYFSDLGKNGESPPSCFKMCFPYNGLFQKAPNGADHNGSAANIGQAVWADELLLWLEFIQDCTQSVLDLEDEAEVNQNAEAPSGPPTPSRNCLTLPSDTNGSESSSQAVEKKQES